MIKIFRRIRRTLLNSNNLKNQNELEHYSDSSKNAGRYLLYAIGEIVLVVIGILIALQINNWNENRINRIQEQQILSQLKIEFKENLVEIDNKIRMRNDMIDASVRIMSVKENKINNVPFDTIASDFMTINNTPTFDPVVGTINEILSSGKLYLLTNNNLKTMLTNWSGQVNRLTEYEQDLRNYSINYFYPYITNEHSIKQLFNGNWQSNRLNSFKIDNTEAIIALIEDRSIDDYILTISDQCYITNKEAFNVRQNIELILELIDLELFMN